MTDNRSIYMHSFTLLACALTLTEAFCATAIVAGRLFCVPPVASAETITARKPEPLDSRQGTLTISFINYTSVAHLICSSEEKKCVPLLFLNKDPISFKVV